MKLSIIVPIYNVELYLERCIESLLNQNLTNNDYEIILVNDGSTDNSGLIAERYKKHPNIHVLSKLNGGLSSARNKGIEAASGKYIMFVDSDDYLFPNVLYELYSTCEEYNLDICHYKLAVMKQDGSIIEDSFVGYSYKRIYTGYEVIKDGQMIGSVCSNIYKRSIFKEHNLSFHEGITHEDVEFTTRLFTYISRFMLIDKAPYLYFYNPVSLSTDKSFDKLNKYICDDIVVSHLIRQFSFQIQDKQMKDILLRRCNSSIVGAFLSLLRNKSLPIAIINNFILQAKDYNEYPIVGKTITWKTSLLKCIFNNEFIYRFLIKLTR